MFRNSKLRVDSRPLLSLLLDIVVPQTDRETEADTGKILTDRLHENLT